MFSIRLEVHVTGLEGLISVLERLIPVKDEDDCNPRLTGGKIVYIVQDTQTDVNYEVTGVQATDSLGQPADASTLKYVHSSSDDTVLTATVNPGDQTKGTLHIMGKEGAGTVNVDIFLPDGTTKVGALAGNFTVTAGPVSGISGGVLTFDGLTEAPAGP